MGNFAQLSKNTTQINKSSESNIMENGMWKERVIMDAIRLPRNIYRWDSYGYSQLVHK